MEVTNTSKSRSDINLKNNSKGTVGQVDYKQPNIAANQKVDFGYNETSRTTINKVLGNQTSEILNKLQPIKGEISTIKSAGDSK